MFDHIPRLTSGIFIKLLMTISEARKILGKTAEAMTDMEIEQDIRTATLFKELFFEITSSQGQYNKLCNNDFNVNQTTSSNIY
jgi:hypothetical protein